MTLAFHFIASDPGLLAAQPHLHGPLPTALPALDLPLAGRLRGLHGALPAAISKAAARRQPPPAAGLASSLAAACRALPASEEDGAPEGCAGLRYAPAERLGQ